MRTIMPAYSSNKLLPTENPTIDPVEAQRLMQRLLADKIDNFADIDELRMLLVAGAQADGIVQEGLTPLHYACYRGYYAAAKLLLVRGAKVNAVNLIGLSPLHICCEKGDARMAKLLIEYMATITYVINDPTAEFPSRDRIEEPLRMAIENGHYECAKLLLDKGADANMRYFMGPEITYVRPLDTRFLRLLLSYNADPNVYSRSGMTPLMKACRHREKGIKSIQLLLDYGADINAQARASQDFRTPLHYAVTSGCVELVSFLIKNGASINLPSTYSKPCALQVAIMKDDVDIVRLLLENGADPDIAHGCYGSSLHIALCAKREHQLEIVQMMLDHGANPNLIAIDANERAMKTPFVEYFRTSEDQMPDPRIVINLLSHGGRVICKHSQNDPRGQLRNVSNLLESCPLLGFHLLTLAECIDHHAVQRSGHQNGLNSKPKTTAVRCQAADFLSTPLTLKQLCRLQVRSNLYPISPSKLEQYPLPPHLKNYILGKV